ncbi:MAG: hypothetical protein U5K71_04695 [Gracilimonas sp.]|nr:hypothetical protein [Gracilimonas sp.]
MLFQELLVIPAPASISASDIDLTSKSIFEQELNDVVDRIMNESSADLFLLNIPDPLILPYFTTISWFYSSEEWEDSGSIVEFLVGCMILSIPEFKNTIRVRISAIADHLLHLIVMVGVVLGQR